jgi:hypothetical protein
LEEEEISRVCSMRRIDEKYMQDYGFEARRKEKSTKMLMYVEG